MPLVELGYDTEEENVFQHIFSKEISAILSDQRQAWRRIASSLSPTSSHRWPFPTKVDSDDEDDFDDEDHHNFGEEEE